MIKNDVLSTQRDNMFYLESLILQGFQEIAS